MFKHKFTKEQKAEIEPAHEQPMNSRSSARLEVLWMRMHGEKYADIAATTGYHPVYISELLRKYQERGLQAVLYPYRNRKNKNKN